MARIRNKAATAKAPASADNDPTPERMTRDDFAVIQAERMPGERLGAKGVATTARKQVSRAVRMLNDGWIAKNEAAALERFSLLIEAAGYGNTRSALDMSPRGGGSYEAARDTLAEARSALARARNAVEGDGRGMVPLIFVTAVLAPYGGETMTDVIDRLLRGAREDRRELARCYCQFVASRLVDHFGA